MKIKNKKNTAKKIMTIAAFASLVAVGSIYSYKFGFFTSEPSAIGSSTVSDIASGGVLYRDNKQTKQVPIDHIQAAPREKVEYRSKEIEIKDKANAAVLSWKQSSTTGVKLEVRTKNGSSWSQWTEAQADDPGKDAASADFSNTLVLAKNIDDFQYRFTLSGSESETSASIDLSNSKIVTIDSSSGPSEKQTLLQTVSGTLFSSAQASTPTPSVITRQQWGNPEPNSSTAWPPEYAKLGRVILHHTATVESGDSYADVRAIWQYHTHSLGWGDIGYHYIIDSKGRIFEGRYQDKEYAEKNRVEVIGGHAYGNNVGTVGVSMIGNYQDQTPTNAALDSMSKITGYKLARYSIDPKGSGPFGQAVVGHYQVYATACPGTNIINRFDSIKAKASEYYAVYVLENFVPLRTPRWMQVRGTGATKIDTTTGEPVREALAPGQQIKFMDKILVNEKWYLRTEYNYNDGGLYAIDQSTLEEIPYKSIPPKWMTFTVDGNRSHPASRTSIGDLLIRGTSIKAVDTITIDGNVYYRTEYNHNNNQDYGIHERFLTDFAPIPLNAPRNFTTANTVEKIDPQTGLLSTVSSPNGTYMINKKTLVNGVWYFQADSDNATNRFLQGKDLKELQYMPFKGPRTMLLNKDSRRINPYTNAEYDMLLKNTKLSLASKIYLHNQWYYRTAYNTQNHTDAVIPAVNFDELPK